MLSDAEARIIYNITREVIDLFNRKGSISDWPSWVQAAMLLDHTVIPCDYFVPEELYRTAEKIIEEAKNWDYRVEYYQEIDGKKANVTIEDYIKLFNRIKDWLESHDEGRSLHKLINEHFQKMFGADEDEEDSIKKVDSSKYKKIDDYVEKK